MLRLKEKTVLVTAAGQGIGYASVERLLQEGARVIATDINITPLSQLQEKYPQLIIEWLDVTNSELIAELAKKYDDVNVLFNCAGYVHDGNVLTCSDAQWKFSFDINVNAMFHTIQCFLPNMLKHGSGHIINMASVASSIKGVANRCAYSASKAAVIGLTKSVANDFIHQGIRCNAICPGTVQSPSLNERIRNMEGDEQAIRQAFIARQPMGRLGKATEIAALVAYLASDESEFMTGTTQIIDGGWSN